jgi:integrase
MDSSEDAKRKARRHASGDGTTWQDKHGQWWAALRFTKGQRPYKVRAASEKDAEAKLKALRKRRDASIQAPTAQTVEAWCNTWLRDVAGLHTKRKTQLGYRQHLENYILPILGDVRLNDLKPEHIRSMQSKLIKLRLAPRTINGAHTTLNAALEVAVNDRIIPYNPGRSVKKLKAPPVIVTPLAPSEAAAILWAVEGHRLEALYHLSFLGLRKGELLGIRISDVDMAAGVLHIEQQAVELENSTMVIDTPKTENSKRILPLSPALLTILRQRLEMLLIERGKNGWQEHGLLFPSDTGTIMIQRSLDRNLKSMLRTAGIVRRWTWHMFRHTVVSWLTDLGVTNEIIQAIVGHADDSITDRYRHIGLDALRGALETMQAARLGQRYEPSEEQVKDRAWRLQSAGVKRRSEG